jgi:transcriptional regulator GlxA family with amidase domain
LEYLHSILSSRALIAAIANDHCVSERVEELMATLLHRTCLPAIRDDTPDLTVSRDVRRAEAYVRANLADDIDLADIAKAAGVSGRTLQASFERCHKVSPMRFLRNLRLDIARERILSGATVADAAFDSGFSHQGRFAKYYCERFGELPSSGAARALFSC